MKFLKFFMLALTLITSPALSKTVMICEETSDGRVCYQQTIEEKEQAETFYLGSFAKGCFMVGIGCIGAYYFDKFMLSGEVFGFINNTLSNFVPYRCGTAVTSTYWNVLKFHWYNWLESNKPESSRSVGSTFSNGWEMGKAFWNTGTGCADIELYCPAFISQNIGCNKK